MNESEYLAFVTPITNKIFRFSKRILVSREEAEDATQDVLIKLWKKRQRLGDYNNPEAYAMTITKNHCLDRLKSRQAQNLRIAHENFHNDQVTSLQSKIETSDSISLLENLIKILPEKQQLIVQLRDVECYDFKEISKILDMRETAIRVALSRARKTLKTRLIQLHNHGIKKN
jgi:RNA polymerase sigma-70 factor (ECF subfamily)